MCVLYAVLNSSARGNSCEDGVLVRMDEQQKAHISRLRLITRQLKRPRQNHFQVLNLNVLWERDPSQAPGMSSTCVPARELLYQQKMAR